MALKTDAVGKTYPPVNYAVGREKVREFASAVGEENPLHHDPDAAREAGYADVVAPPMFAVVYRAARWRRRCSTPRSASTSPAWSTAARSSSGDRPVVAGDEIATEVEVKDIAERGGLQFFVFESRSTNQDGETVCTGTWTNIVR